MNAVEFGKNLFNRVDELTTKIVKATDVIKAVDEELHLMPEPFRTDILCLFIKAVTNCDSVEESNNKKAKRVSFNEIIAWDEWCPEYYCSNCKCKIAENKEDAKKLSSCPYCHLEFEEEE